MSADDHAGHDISVTQVRDDKTNKVISSEIYCDTCQKQIG
jgi:hypothetical protein